MKTNKQSWKTILAAIGDTQSKEITCSELSDEILARFAEMRVAGRKPMGAFALIEQHMRHCPDCAQQLTDIVAALHLAAAEDALASPPSARPFDLGFLRGFAAGDTLPERVQVAFKRGVAWMQDQQGDLWINLAVDNGLNMTSNYVSVTKGVGKTIDEADELYHLVLGAEEVNDLDLEVIGRSDDESGFCILTVQAVIPSRWPQIGGIEVDLYSDSNVRHASTNDDGYAIFREIPVTELPDIRVRVAR